MFYFSLYSRLGNNRNYSLSNSHAGIAFENIFQHFDGDYHLSMIISCSDVNYAKERTSVFKKCVSLTHGHVWISHSMAYV